MCNNGNKKFSLLHLYCFLSFSISAWISASMNAVSLSLFQWIKIIDQAPSTQKALYYICTWSTAFRDDDRIFLYFSKY